MKQHVTTLDAKDCTSYHCPHCGNERFTSVFQFFEVPIFYQLMARGDTITVQLWECKECGKMVKREEMVKKTPQEREEERDLKSKLQVSLDSY